MIRTFGFLGALFAGLGVLAGAFGTHALRESKTAREMEIWSTASTYQIFHGIALLVLAALASKLAFEKRARVSGWLFVTGVVVFSGSLYAIVLTGQTKLGMVAPVGGLSLMVGWAVFAWCCLGSQPATKHND
ncbi:MAG: DUF423 domain-containing protein [Fimbriimonadaceae bacterium]|nr:DUF423 domain-containing protein [Fimbriimonadaceae bacterium]